MGNIGAWELFIIVILVVVIFGGKKLPELGRGLGKGLANFRQAVREPDPPAGLRPESSPVTTEKNVAVEPVEPSAPAGSEGKGNDSAAGADDAEGGR